MLSENPESQEFTGVVPVIYVGNWKDYFSRTNNHQMMIKALAQYGICRGILPPTSEQEVKLGVMRVTQGLHESYRVNRAAIGEGMGSSTWVVQ